MADKTGGNAATVIAIILLLFVTYIIFLPAEEREDLLGTDGAYSSGGGGSGGSGSGGVARRVWLVNESIGHLESTRESNITHEIPNLNLFEGMETRTLVRFSPFDVSRGWFSRNDKTHVFLIDNLGSVDRAILTFQAPKYSGDLRILFNGVEVFYEKVRSASVPPIELPRALLREENTLEFQARGGMFESKRYSLSDVQVLGDFRDASRTAARFDFGMPSDEYAAFERARFEFFALCNDATVGRMAISLNGRSVYDSAPHCDTKTIQDLFKNDFVEGRNTLEFTLDKGAVQLEAVRLKTILEPTEPFITYFFVNSTVHRALNGSSRWANLTIRFVEDAQFDKKREQKKADLVVNGVLFTIDQRETVYERDITPHVLEGNNYIRLLPRSDLDIVKMTVLAQER